MKSHLNLLPEQVRRRQIVRSRLGRWGAVWAASATLVAAAGLIQWNRSHSSQLHVDSLEREFAPIQRLQRETVAIRKEMEQLRSREAAALALTDQRPLLTLMATIGEATRRSNGQVFVRKFVLEKMPQPANAPPRQARYRLQLQGAGTDNLVISDFARNLRESERFGSVQLSSTGNATSGDNPARSYVLECMF